jgi:hypothetical protein
MKFASYLYSTKQVDQGESEEDYNKFRFGMLGSVIFSILALIFKLVSIISDTMENPDESKDYQSPFER